MSDQLGSGQTNADAAGIWSGPYLQITLANMSVVAVVAFGTLALVAALSSIAEDLGHVAMLPWVLIGYSAMSAIAVVIAGPIIDAVGVRRTFRVSGVFFLVTTAAATVAPSMLALVIARAAQGFGGGLIFAVVFAGIGLGYPHRLRPRVFVTQSVVFGVMGFGGPVVTGVLLAFSDWRSVFVVQLLLTAIALLLGWNRLPTTRERPAKIETDWLGMLLVTLLIASSLVAVGQIAVRWWLVGLSLMATLLFALVYWRHSGRAESPVLSREHLTRFPLGSLHITSGLVLFIALGVDNYLPLYVQTTRGKSVEFAAFSLIFLTVGWSLGSLLYSRMSSRWTESDTILLGSLMLIPAVAVAGLTIAFDWPLGVLFVASVLIGLSVGLVVTPGLTLLQASSELSEMGRVTAAHQFVRQLCITFGIAFTSAILLLVVDREVGDVETVRSVIAGEDIALGPETKDAIRHGLAWIHLLTGSIALVCLAIAISLVRRTRSTKGNRLDVIATDL